MKIVVDAFGGDNAPKEIVKGAVMALKNYPDLTVILCGYEDKIKEVLLDCEYDSNRLEIVNTTSVISNDEVPTVAIKEKNDSSLVVAFDILKKNEDVIGLVSAGSTGAILAGGFLKIGRVKGVSRPALCPLLPNKKGGYTLLLDAGANVDCKPINLCHFAAMGTAYYTKLLGVEKPRVALLSLGVEDHKGNDLVKQTFPLLKQMEMINFVGNMEARDLISGDYDIVVADGFAGNVALKATEGAMKMLLSELKSACTNNLKSKIGALFLRRQFKSLKKKFDFDVYGGSPFLGCKKLIMKSHGSSKAIAIANSIKTVIDLHKTNMNELIQEIISKVEITEQ